MQLRSRVLVPTLAIALSACVHKHAHMGPVATAPAALGGDPAHPGAAKGWVDTKLYFGLGPADQSDRGVTEAEWRAFLDHEVSPRFPAGFSVLEVYGQWQGKAQTTPERLRTKMLILDYADTPENRSKVDAIRSAWKQKTGDQSVLRITEPADVSF